MALALNSPIEITVSEAVLGLETNDSRFEAFCREAVSRIEGGVRIFSTSTSWDLGRDGVGAGAARGIYVCASLRDDVDVKALTDIQRLTATTTNIVRVYFCSSSKLTEHRTSLLESQISKEIDGAFPIICLGARQLLEALSSNPEVVTQFYGAEIRDALRAISDDPSDEAEVRGLRLALIAAAGDSSSEIRRELYCGGLTEVLSDRTPRTLVGCAKALSERLHLGHVISEAALLPHISNLASLGLIRKDGELWRITDQGVQHHQELRISAAERLISGRKSVHKALEASLGEAVSEDDFNRIWKVFEDRVSRNFYARGNALVAEVSALLNVDKNLPSSTSLGGLSQISFLDELATAVANTSSHPHRRSELHQATKDLFEDRTSGATDWLVRVCASFLACCALGLEHTSGDALTKLFRRTTLILDSDVVLSLLGEGEPEHQSVFTIASKWTRLGGKVLVAEPVLEEVAYHASIAKTDFQYVRHLIPGTPEDRLHIIDNVFVRSFAEIMSRGDAALEHWRRFIQQYVGTMPYDWGRVLAHLTAEYAIAKMPPTSSDYHALVARVRSYLLEVAARKGYSGKVVTDKATRDAKLYAGLVQYQKVIATSDPGATCLLVSSGHRLADAERRFQESGENQVVVTISTILHLLSLLPQVSLGLTAMKAFLFEERRPGFSSDLERSILRMVRTSREVSLPWAKRGLLTRAVRDGLIDDARKQGRKIDSSSNTASLEAEALSDENKGRTIQILGESLDKVVVTTRLEDENRQLRKEIEVLKARLETEHAQKRKR